MTKIWNSDISLNDILKHKNSYSFYDKHRKEILQIIPYNSTDIYIRRDSQEIIQKNQQRYRDLIFCCLSFFGLSFYHGRDISIDNSKERKDMLKDTINCKFMKTLISSLFLYDQNTSLVLYSYYSDKVDDDHLYFYAFYIYIF